MPAPCSGCERLAADVQRLREQAARRIVVGTRETNALGKLVTGETATEHEL